MGVRTRLLFAAVGAVALALVIGVAAFNMVLTQRLTDNAVSLAHAQAEEELASLEVLDGKLVVREGLERQEGARPPRDRHWLRSWSIARHRRTPAIAP